MLAAGGIVDGRGMVAAFGLGADGVVLGTRLWASEEAIGLKTFKNALVSAKSCDDVVRTEVFDLICNSYRTVQWPIPYDSSGVLRNDTTKKWDQKLGELEVELQRPFNGMNVAKEFQKSLEGHRINSACVYSGQGVGEISAIEPAFDIVMRVEKEALESLTKLQELLVAKGE